MQIGLNKSKHRIMSMVCLFILVSTLMFVMPGDKTPLEIRVVVITQLIILLSSIVLCRFENKDIDGLLAIITVFLSVIMLLSMIVFQSTLTIYYDDCSEIILFFDKGVDISRNDCINYAIENPATTDVELVNHFKQNVKEKEITSGVLQRQLEP